MVPPGSFWGCIKCNRSNGGNCWGITACVLHPMMNNPQSDFVCALQKTKGSAVIFKRWPARNLAVPLWGQKGNAFQGADPTSLCHGNFYLVLLTDSLQCHGGVWPPRSRWPFLGAPGRKISTRQIHNVPMYTEQQENELSGQNLKLELLLPKPKK